MNKWHYTKPKFCTAKEIINKMKRQPAKWKKFFANDLSDKQLMSKLCEELIQINNNKTQLKNEWRS